MEFQKLILSVVLFSCVQSHPVKVLLSLDVDTSEEIRFHMSRDPPENATSSGTMKKQPGVMEQIMEVNKNLKGNKFGGTSIVFGDIAVDNSLETADQCATSSCRWPKSSNDGYVYVPYEIYPHYDQSEQSIIRRGMEGLERETCIRFRPHSSERDYLTIMPYTGCWSYIGRRGGQQLVSLQKNACVYEGTVQHELLHALGFHHEQSRSDRDDYVDIHYENIIPSMVFNFRKVNTNNLNTPYDYSSIMHYPKNAFSYTGYPTIVPKPDPNVAIGESRVLSQLDIYRVNILYECYRMDKTEEK